MYRPKLTALVLAGILVAGPAIAADAKAPTDTMAPSHSMAPTAAGMMATHAPHKGTKAHPAKTGTAATHSNQMMPANSMGGTH